MKKISVIIVNYCTKGLLEKNLSNILNSYSNCEVIFIDSDSPDGSADFVEKGFGKNPRFILIRNRNEGLSSGYNIGLEKVTGDYILYLGTDAFPTGDTLEALVEYMDKNPDVGIATPKLFTRDGAIDMDAHRSFITPWIGFTHFFTRLDRLFPKSRIFNQYTKQYEDFNSIHEIDACISHFMFVRPEVHKVVGGWDEDFFLYGEDIDFCYRVKQAGYKIMYLGNLKVLHYKGAGVGRKTSEDIENAMNTDFDKISFKGETFIAKKEESVGDSSKKKSKKLSSSKLWIKMKIAKESTKAMRIFYNKHLTKKYPFYLNWLVLFGIWINEQKRAASVWIRNYL